MTTAGLHPETLVREDGVRREIYRDPEVFADPDRFDIYRKRLRHYGFGYGPHICIGQHLARLEMTRAVNAIMDRLPNLRLDPDKPPPVVRGGVMRTPRSVFVRFGTGETK